MQNKLFNENFKKKDLRKQPFKSLKFVVISKRSRNNLPVLTKKDMHKKPYLLDLKMHNFP